MRCHRSSASVDAPRALGVAWLFVAVAAATLPIVSAAQAQVVAPVTVPDSPTAWQLYQQAVDQARENPAEAARIAQRLLDGFADRVMPADDPPGDRFESVLERVERFLRERPTALERYRQLESPEAERLAAQATTDAAWEAIARGRGLTPTGLRANLMLAEKEFRASAFERSLARLRRIDGHPDLEDVALSSAYWFLRGANGACLGVVAEREEAINRLRQLNDPKATEAAAAVERLAEIEPLEGLEAIGVLDQGRAPAEGEATGAWQPIWRLPLANTAFSRLFSATRAQPDPNDRFLQFADLDMQATPRQFDRARFDGSMLSVAPTVVGDLLLVSDGIDLIALDRLSHRKQWSHTIGTSAPESIPSGELAGVAVGDGLAVIATSDMPSGFRTLGGRVMCVEIASGQRLWTRELSSLTPPPDSPPDAFDSLVPIGQPIIGSGVVYLVARRVTAQLETLEYLLAFDARSGAQRFATFVCSSAGIPRFGARSTSFPVLRDGFVYIVTSVGAVACLNASDGRVRWIHRFVVPIRDDPYPSEPWELSSPVVLGDSLWAVAPDKREVVQIDRATGRRVAGHATGATSTWGTPRYLLADDGEGVRPPRLYAIGADIVAIDPDAPERARWTLSKANPDAIKNRQGNVNRTGMRGRVQLAGDLLVVPGIADVLFVDRSTGVIRDRIEIDGPANPLLVGPQLFLGENSGLSALMPADSAERLMRERIAASPHDPEGGLALLDLGLRVGKIEVCIDAARAASAALASATGDAAASARAELVERLLRAAALADVPPERSREILAVLGEVAVSPPDRVRYLLAAAERYRAEGAAREAIVALDEILATPVLAAVEVEDNTATARPAVARALEQLALLGDVDPAAFAARDASARAALTAAGTDPAALRDVVRRAAGTRTSIDATRALAQVFEDRGEREAALGVILAELRTLPPSGSDAASLAGDALRLATKAGWLRTASDLADVALLRMPSTPVPSGSESLAALARSSDASPALGATAGEAFELPGRVLPVPLTAESAARIGGFLLNAERTLSLIEPATMKKRWTIDLGDRDPAVIGVGGPLGDGMLVWETSLGPSLGARAVVRDVKTGAVRSATPGLERLLADEDALDAGRPVLQVMPDGEQFDPTDLLPVVSDRSLVVLRRNGDAVGFSTDDLTKPAWTRRRVIDQVYNVISSDQVVVVSGRLPQVDPRIEGRPCLVVLDPRNGRELGRATFAISDDVRWMRLTPTGELVIGTGGMIEAYDALTAFADERSPTRPDSTTLDFLWRASGARARDTLAAWRFGPWIVTVDRDESIGAIASRDGTIDATRFTTPTGRESRGARLRSAGRIGDSVVLQFEDRLVSFTSDGGFLGEDAVVDDGNYIFAVPIDEGLLAVRSAGGRQVPYPLTGGMRTEFPYLVYRFDVLDGCRLTAPAIQVRLSGQRCERVTAVDGLLLFSTASGTIAVPLRP
ncbi:MAG: PQQ-binding-like beta-propeller repeat protein [Phycisphaerae bacterium]|nr:PQQ-binding-like beta-propeller repeat protein [Phycisphaerae bacterium]